jgi:hypothetical protein
MIYTSLMKMSIEQGLLIGDPSAEDFRFAARPNPALIEATAGFFEETMKAHSFGGIRIAYAGFLRNSMILLALNGETERSRALHARLAAFFGTDKFPPTSCCALQIDIHDIKPRKNRTLFNIVRL